MIDNIPITQTATITPTRADRAGMIIIIMMALTIVMLLSRPGPGRPPLVCEYEVTPVLEGEVKR